MIDDVEEFDRKIEYDLKLDYMWSWWFKQRKSCTRKVGTEVSMHGLNHDDEMKYTTQSLDKVSVWQKFKYLVELL